MQVMQQPEGGAVIMALSAMSWALYDAPISGEDVARDRLVLVYASDSTDPGGADESLHIRFTGLAKCTGLTVEEVKESFRSLARQGLIGYSHSYGYGDDRVDVFNAALEVTRNVS